MFPTLLVRLTSPVGLVSSNVFKALPLISILVKDDIVTTPWHFIPLPLIVTLLLTLEMVTEPVPVRLLIPLDSTRTAPSASRVTLPFDTTP